MSPNPSKEIPEHFETIQGEQDETEVRVINVDAYDVENTAHNTRKGASGYSIHGPAMSEEVARKFIEEEAAKHGLTENDFRLIKLGQLNLRKGGRFVELITGEVVQQAEK